MTVGIIIGIIVLGFVFLSIVLSFIPVRLWIAAAASGVRVGFVQLIGMRFRKVSPARIINPMIMATKAGLELSIDKLEGHLLAGGNVDRVVHALIASQRAGIDVITSYSIHYTKLYETAVNTSRPAKSIAHALSNPSSMPALCEAMSACTTLSTLPVITSYSIHYTKLYDRLC